MNKKSLVSASCILLASFVIASCDMLQERKKDVQLRAPFVVTNIQDNLENPYTKKFKCDPAPHPMRDMFFESMYDKTQGNSSIIDPEAYAKYKEATKPVRTLESGLATTANYYLKTNPPRSEIAACVMSWITVWADQNALLGKSSSNGDFIRKWVLSSIALAYLQVKDDPYISPDLHKQTKDWIRRITERVIKDFSKKPDITSRNNNHMYWAAWGVMAGAIVLDNQKYFDWALYEAKVGINAIDKDSTLPLEMARGPKAYNYHHFAMIPLMMMAHTANINGVDLFDMNKKGLKRLGERILASMEDQSYFEEMTGEEQDLKRTITSSNLVWLEIYNLYYPSETNEKWLKKYRPTKQSRVGGDATLLYSGLPY